LAFATVATIISKANVKSKTPLETGVCGRPFDSNIGKKGRLKQVTPESNQPARFPQTFPTGRATGLSTFLASCCGGDGKIRGRKAGISKGIVPSSWNLRQKRHNVTAVVRDEHLSAGIVTKLSDNTSPVRGIVALGHKIAAFAGGF
jgi:hypothetical protein